MTDPQPFKLLSHEEFARLTKEQKIAYLEAATSALDRRVPIDGLFLDAPVA